MTSGRYGDTDRRRLVAGIIIVALYFFGAFKSPYIGLPYFWLFRFALLLLLMLLMLTFWYGGRERPYEGQDPTINTR